jgi:LPXTG-site transpeptidase (sortase) family protein
MKALAMWIVHFLEWMLLGLGIGCLAIYGFETVEARRFQATQTAAFERAARTQSVQARVAAGGIVGMLDVPRLKLTTPVIQGDDERTLQRAVGHLPDTPMPWEKGNSAIAAHRDGLFRPLKNVRIGDEIRFRTTREEIRYRVTGTSIVEPDDVSVLRPRSKAALTLITCYPFHYIGTAPQRFVVHAERE